MIWDRFWTKVEKGYNGCWNWTGARDKAGYGLFWVNNHPIRPHRFSYRLFKGPIPPGTEVHHRCRNRSCPNPHHLIAITHADNMVLMRENGYRETVNQQKREERKVQRAMGLLEEARRGS